MIYRGFLQNMRNLSLEKRKILFLLLGGSAIFLNRSPGKRFDIIKTIGGGWKQIRKEEIKQGMETKRGTRKFDLPLKPEKEAGGISGTAQV